MIAAGTIFPIQCLIWEALKPVFRHSYSSIYHHMKTNLNRLLDNKVKTIRKSSSIGKMIMN